MIITEDDLNLKNLTEAIYTIFRITHKFPPFQSLIPNELMLDILVYQGAISPKVFEISQARGKKNSSFINGIAKQINDLYSAKRTKWCISDELATAYFSAVLILSMPSVKTQYFNRLIEFGAVGTANPEDIDDINRHKLFNHKYFHVSWRRWDELQSLYI